jgi:glycosyltransferase involved in cell wall biosynthesis
MSAYACEPNSGSEPGAGWNLAVAAAQNHDVWVLTRANNRDVIEAELSSRPIPGLNFVYFDLSPVWLRAKRVPYGTQIYYLRWQKAIKPLVRRLHAEVSFDLVHHVTFAIDWMPAGAIEALPVPAIWGPVGGRTGMPWALSRYLGIAGLLQEVSRETLTRGLRGFWIRETLRRSSLVVGQTPDEAQLGVHPELLRIEPNCSAEPGGGVRLEPPTWLPSGGKTALFVGRLIPLKGLLIAIEALAQTEAQWRLVVVGDGPDRRRGMRKARRLGVEKRVTFVGRVPHMDVLAGLDNSAVLIAPSMHEGSAFAVAEAVARGCAVVCTDRGGHQVLVGPGQGVRLPANSSLPLAMAAAIHTVQPGAPTDRWSAERWPRLLNAWYGEATKVSR